MTDNLTSGKLVSLPSSSLYKAAARLVVYLYAFEAGTTLTLIGIYKSPAIQWTMMGTRGGIMMVSGIAILLVSGLLMVRESLSRGGESCRMWLLASFSNLVIVLITAVLLEGIFRIMVRETESGLWVMPVVVPYGESELFERSRRAIGGAHPGPMFWRSTFFIYDPELGWTVGKSRATPDGMYASSEEGLRSHSPGIRLRDARPRARVALIGDSNVFSLEVPYQESWAFYLQELLGDNTQVLNFGVDGYGIDQMYLRYHRDVRPWHPDAVLVGFIEHDLWRTMVVYPFLSEAWPGILVKPRFNDRLPVPELLNMPLPTPEEILSVRTAKELPYLAHDPWSTRNWWTSWVGEGPLFLRVVNTLVPHADLPDPRFSEDAVAALNARLLVRMRDTMARDGVTPIFVFLPSGNSTGALTRRTLQLAQLSYSDVSACVAKIPEAQRYVASGHHFSGLANATIARCTSAEVLKALVPSEPS